MSIPLVICFGDSLSAWSFESKDGKGFGDKIRKHFAGRATVENEAWSFNSEEGKGFGDKLTQHFNDRAEVKNEGYPGFTTDGAQGIFQNIMRYITREPDRPVRLFTILLGANDAAWGPQDVPIDKFAANIRGFVDNLVKSNVPALRDTRIILITVPPINLTDPPRTGKFEDLNDEQRLELDTKARDGFGYKVWVNKLRYAEKVAEIAKEFRDGGCDRIFVADAWKTITRYGLELDGRVEELEAPLDVDREGRIFKGSGLPGSGKFPADVFVDGLHFGPKADELVATEVMELVEDL